MNLAQLDFFAKYLKFNNVTTSQAWICLDAVILGYPQTSLYLSPSAWNLKDNTFHYEVFKLESNRGTELPVAEKNSVKSVKTVADFYRNIVDSVQLTVVHRKMKKIQKKNTACELAYIDLFFTHTTANICEPLFLKAGYALLDLLKELIASNFESQIFFHVNKELWDLSEVSLIVTE